MFWIVLIIAALFFSWRNYKKNKPLIAAVSPRRKKKIV
ncbi:membrane protein [Salmonella enterica subsp. enterica]|uniref:Membrane protein n=1 Tax=Salmonella enterica I TaxID=59201 RepID=A0A379WRA8_SALET|nr:membrane protein [Salmonella enterica subsp. enterica]